MKEYLLDFLKQATEADFSQLPNVIFLKHLKDAMDEQGSSRCALERNIANHVISHITVNFSAFGLECSKEDREYLVELAGVTAQVVWKLYDGVAAMGLPDEVFFNQVKGLNLKLT